VNPGDASPLTFPCEFPIKAMGRQGEGFPDRVLGLVARHAPRVGPEQIRVAASRAGRFQSATVTITATSRAQLDAIYRDLAADAAVLMTL